MTPQTEAADRQCLPCVSNLHLGRSAPIFDPQGPMPDALDSWVQVDKGTRWLQIEEP
jgi:hypothetical protein